MEVEPPEAELPKRKRRWFQFRLRTLLVGVTLLAAACAYLVQPLKIARNRNAMRRQILLVDHGATVRYGYKEDGPDPPLENTSGFPVSWERRLFGDEAIAAILLPLDTEKGHVADIHAMFPEARIASYVEASPGSSLWRFVKWFDFADDETAKR